MKQVLSYIVITFMINFPAIGIADGGVAENRLMAEQWELSRDGDSLIKIPVINKVINQWSLIPNQRIELHFPGGEEGELWVGELRDWLVALGIPSKYIVIAPGSGVEDVIKLRVVKIGESYK